MKKKSILTIMLIVLISLTVTSQIKRTNRSYDQNGYQAKMTTSHYMGEVTNQDDLNGTWYWKSDNNVNNIELTLNQTDNLASGKHCSSFQNGAKVDCASPQDVNSISLTMVSNNVFEGTLRSEFSDVLINIRITLNPLNETILFQQLTQPDGEYYLPNNVTLTLAQD